ncbi:hypothetical protein NDU88_009784 [Pleurodeles waltl]|uniref:Uncharacterized protein n=1 Tax=Pleurodeles waltl TaxID=8319 RepID=A0AAV7S0P7_PLEWA|nr:hypothetical protein NDU88_009784 [Pleurodeles waltl]
MAAQVTPPCSATSLAYSCATDCILQEITMVGRRMEAMDLKISNLSAASTSILADIACFQVMVTGVDQRLTIVEDHIAALPERDTEMQSLRAKITDLEDRKRALRMLVSRPSPRALRWAIVAKVLGYRYWDNILQWAQIHGDLAYENTQTQVFSNYICNVQAMQC